MQSEETDESELEYECNQQNTTYCHLQGDEH